MTRPAKLDGAGRALSTGTFQARRTGAVGGASRRRRVAWRVAGRPAKHAPGGAVGGRQHAIGAGRAWLIPRRRRPGPTSAYATGARAGESELPTRRRERRASRHPTAPEDTIPRGGRKRPNPNMWWWWRAGGRRAPVRASTGRRVGFWGRARPIARRRPVYGRLRAPACIVARSCDNHTMRGPKYQPDEDADILATLAPPAARRRPCASAIRG